MSKSKARKPEAGSIPKPARHNGAVPADKTSPSAAAPPFNGLPPTDANTELAEKIKELVRRAQEQGHLTYNDISEALPESAIEPEKLGLIFTQLRSFEIETVDQAEVDRVT